MAKTKKLSVARMGAARVGPARLGIAVSRPNYFFSFSSGEPQVESFFSECLEVVFGKHFEMVRTPSALKSGESQHEVILKSIKNCNFGVVCLDGLRPNVVFEYGAMRGAGKPVLVFKEETATIDIGHFFANVVDLALLPPPMDLDKHFSDTKDRFYSSWKRHELRKTLTTIWDAYRNTCSGSEGLTEIPGPEV